MTIALNIVVGLLVLAVPLAACWVVGRALRPGDAEISLLDDFTLGAALVVLVGATVGGIGLLAFNIGRAVLP